MRNWDFSQMGKYSRNNLIALLLGDGASKKLPARGILPAILIPGTQYRVYLAEQAQPRGEGRLARHNPRNHRIFVICTCGAHVPAGRMSQHLGSKVCSDRRRDNMSHLYDGPPEPCDTREQDFYDGLSNAYAAIAAER